MSPSQDTERDLWSFLVTIVTESFSWPLGIGSWPLRAIARMRRL